jgi:ABC-type bacteriocin/lantibiotic exporter with double-glycine peptidase domain
MVTAVLGRAAGKVMAKIRPGAPDRPMFSRAAIVYVTSYFRSKWKPIALYALIGAGQSLLVLPSFYLVRTAFDNAIPNGDVEMLIWIGLALLGLRLGTSLVTLAMRVYATRIVKAGIRDMRRDLMAKLFSLSRDFYVQAETERLHTRIVQETERTDNTCNALLANILPSLPAALCLGIALLWLNWWLTLLAACVAPIVFISTRMTGRYVQRHVHEFHRAFEAFSHGVRFVIRQMDLTRIRGYETEELARQTTMLERVYESGAKMMSSYAIHSQVQQNTTGLAGLILLVFGGIAIANKTMSVGDFMVFYLAAGSLNGFVDKISSAIPELINGNEALLTLLEIQNSGPSEPYVGTQAVRSESVLRLDHVHYSIAGRQILRDVSLAIAPGANIAIIGPNGAGKSTILNILIGVTVPSSGQVTADGVDYADLDIRALRRSVGMVLQHPTFFQGTIAENICYGMTETDPDLCRQAMIEAARQSNADGFIQALPAGYETEIGDEGTRLSGGELQRIAIARALVNRPKLLILDEPTNHLDTISVGRLMRSLTGGSGQPAVLTVSHDPGVIAFAQEVYRLDNGGLRLETRQAVAS